MADEGNPLVTFFELLGVVLVFLIGAIILTYFINFLPTNPFSSAIRGIYLSIFGFFDKSFFFILIIALVFDLFRAYMKPSITLGISNIILLFGFAFIFINLQTAFLTGLNALDFNAIMPYTASTLSSPYLAAVIFFMLIVATVFNFRTPSHNEHKDLSEGYSGGNMT